MRPGTAIVLLLIIIALAVAAFYQLVVAAGR